MRKCFIVIASMIWILCHDAHAQSDSLFTSDSLFIERKFEDIIEQTGENDDSPLMEFYELNVVNQAINLQLRSRYIERLQQPDGFLNGIYDGSSLKSYQRIKFSQGDHYSGGFLIEKDAGEKKFNDFTTGNVMISNYGMLSKLAGGDFFVEAGQGIALWRSYDVAKGPDVILPVMRKGSGLKPYLSSGESGFLRGVATELKIGKLIPIFFYSNINRSATLDTNGNLTSFYDVGYFRTESEKAKKNSIKEQLIGSRCLYSFAEFQSIGLTFYNSKYSRNLLFDGGRKYSGNNLSITSIDYSYRWNDFSTFGELSRSNGVVAGNTGLVVTPSDDSGVIVFVRYYPYRFVSLHGLGFGEQTSNEQGLYFGFHLNLTDWISLSTYYDQFKSLERTSLPFSTAGRDFLAQFELSFLSNLDATIKYHRKVSNEPYIAFDGNGFNKQVISTQQKQNIRISIDYRISTKITLRERFEQVFLDNNSSGKNETGFMMYQDILFRPNPKLMVNLRVAYFRTDSYFSGVSEYERDLEGVLTQPILYGSGIRWYCLMRYEAANFLKISLKYSDYIRDDVKRLGTGLDELPGNHDNRVSAQLDFRL